MFLNDKKEKEIEMSSLRKLQTNLKRALNDEEKSALIYNYLLDETNQKHVSFIESIRDLGLTPVKMLVDIYADETECSTIEDLISSGRHIMFEWSNELYFFAGIENGVAKFTKGTNPEIINPPFALTDKVKRLF